MSINLVSRRSYWLSSVMDWKGLLSCRYVLNLRGKELRLRLEGYERALNELRIAADPEIGDQPASGWLDWVE